MISCLFAVVWETCCNHSEPFENAKFCGFRPVRFNVSDRRREEKDGEKMKNAFHFLNVSIF
uniref:Uncharacterized protein n=1 Tax=Ascaris lumbricoides TaxID=6252 RepID=A0A0M3ICQ5_ASCLU